MLKLGGPDDTCLFPPAMSLNHTTADRVDSHSISFTCKETDYHVVHRPSNIMQVYTYYSTGGSMGSPEDSVDSKSTSKLLNFNLLSPHLPMVTTVPSFTELTCGIKAVTQAKGLTHVKCSTDTGDYYFAIIILEKFNQNSSKTNPADPLFFPSILKVSYGPSHFSAGSDSHTTF